MSASTKASDHPDEAHMRVALRLALENVRDGGGGPFGVVVVRDGQVIATGVNQVTTSNDPTAHAEIVAIRRACAVVGGFQLDGCTVYASCEPCPMCLGALYWARPAAVFYAATRTDAAAAGFDDALIWQELTVPNESRRLRMVQLLPEEAAAAFDAWRSSATRIDY